MRTHFVFESDAGPVVRTSGYRLRAPRDSDPRYEHGALRDEDLPPSVDLRPTLTPVEDQRGTSSCVANAVAGAYEHLVKRHGRADGYDVSRLFIYYNARAIDADVDPSDDDVALDDQGTVIASAIEGLRRFGACAETTWPFEPRRVRDRPEGDAYTEAADFLVEQVERVETDLNAWRHALAEGHPIIFGLALFDSFDRHRKPGLVPMPTRREASRAEHSGHAMLCVGYSDADEVFVVRNSWGSDWGDDGYCYIPYDYLVNRRYNDGDSWIIRRLENAEVDRSTWGDATPMLQRLETTLALMSEDDFGALTDAVGEVPVETRLAHLFLCAAGADGEITDEEQQAIAGYLAPVLESLGSRWSADRVLRRALSRVDDEALLDSTIEVFGEHLPATGLASIIKGVQEAVAADDDEADDDEQDFVAALVEAWQIEDDSTEEESE